MRNKLVVIAIVICSFLFLDHVSAISNERTYTYALNYDNDHIEHLFDYENNSTYNNFSLDDILSRYYKVYEQNKEQYPYYVITMSYVSDNSTRFDFFLYSSEPTTYRQYGQYTGSSIKYGFVTDGNSTILRIYENITFSTTSLPDISLSSLSKISYSLTYWNNWYVYFSTSSDYVDSTTLNAKSVIYDSNLPFDFRMLYGDTSVNFKLGGVYYENRDIFPMMKDYYNNTPKITLKLENSELNDDGEPTEKKISIDWNIKDNSKYRYMYKLPNSDDWLYFNTEDKIDTLLVRENGAYIFRVDDLEGNTIDGTAITITGIVSSIPRITLYTENTMYNDDHQLIQLKIHIHWSEKNLDKYQYRFKTINNSNYRYFFTDDNNDEVIVNANDIYIFEIVDKEGNIVAQLPLDINLLYDELPTLKLESSQSPSCFYKNQQFCEIITLYSSNANFSKYTLQYRLGDGAWITHNYDNSALGEIIIYENTTITGRIIRNSDNKVIDAASYTITKINPDIITNVPEIEWEKLFCTPLINAPHEYGTQQYKQTLGITIYGLDLTRHRVFASTDNGNTFEELTEFSYIDRVPLVKHYAFEYYQDTVIIIKITDLDGNYLVGTAYTLHFTCENYTTPDEEIKDVNDVFTVVKNFFSKYKTIMSKIKEVIEYFYNSMNDEIKAFILTAFILIIVSNLIMRMMK